MASEETGAGSPADTPGNGWSNGSLRPEMFPVTRDGKLQLYSAQRRWLHLTASWSRIGQGDDQFSHRTGSSSVGAAVAESPGDEARAVRSLIAQLCEQFYRFGWATGTGGGISIRVGGPAENRPWRVFVAPSGIQKEDMIGDDVFELDMQRNVVVPPKTPNLRQSACTPLWYVVYRHRPSARAVIHTHSIHAQIVTLLDPTETSDTLKLTHLEMLKGVGNHAYDDLLEVPIIDNRPSEDLLAAQLETAILNYPKSNAVLVRRHGLYVWGDSWEQAKTQCESFDYLFQSAVEMHKLGIDLSKKPKAGTYRVDQDASKASAEPPAKKAKVADGFNGMGQTDNAQDLVGNDVPILPRDGKHLLLDIEGCTTAISFVKETLFPFVVDNVDEYTGSLSADERKELSNALERDLRGHAPELLDGLEDKSVPSMVRLMVKNDFKLQSLKSMQGKLWKAGYEQGKLKGHVYADFVPLLHWCKAQGVQVHIYSSGSVQAQKLLFGNSERGDLTGFLTSHFDISTSGNKKQSSSYASIASSLGVFPSEIVFVSDAEAELAAAAEAGIGRTVMSIRPGNVPLTEDGKKFPRVFSLLQLCGA